MPVVLPPPTGDAKNPPTDVTLWGKFFTWVYLLWEWVTKTIPGRLTFGGDAGSYSAALFASAGQSDTGGIEILGYIPVFNAGPLSTAQSVANNTWTTITNWQTPITDVPAGGFNVTSGTYTFQRNGFYILSCGISMASAVWNSTALGVRFFINGSLAPNDAFTRCNNATSSTNMETPTLVYSGYFHKGDTVVVQVFQNSGAAVNTEGSHNRFTATWVGNTTSPAT